MAALAFVTMLGGLAALALSMDRHAAHLHAAHLPWAVAHLRRGWTLRALGCAGLAASLACTLASGGSAAIILWTGLLAPGTLTVASALSLADRLAKRSSGRCHRAHAAKSRSASAGASRSGD
ncbi:hypothetical protein C8239_08030 [Paracidovorax avenae]|uniref:DUF3325 family protein n=1 Tax=Paracidovorax avenae TaxID=80867 RepID=UPI000D2129E8|nr:hypothetical protein C8239_08030 [Paracidovorax avenae]